MLKQPRDWLSSVLFILRVLQINSYANKKQIEHTPRSRKL